MKKVLISMVMACAAMSMMAQQKPAIPRDEALEAKVEKTLAKMTLDEKIGQMLELNLDVMGKMAIENNSEGTPTPVWKLNEAMLDTCI